MSISIEELKRSLDTRTIILYRDKISEEEGFIITEEYITKEDADIRYPGFDILEVGNPEVPTEEEFNDDVDDFEDDIPSELYDKFVLVEVNAKEDVKVATVNYIKAFNYDSAKTLTYTKSKCEDLAKMFKSNGNIDYYVWSIGDILETKAKLS